MNRTISFRFITIVGLIILLAALLLTAQQGQAQGLTVEGEAAPLAGLGDAFTYQGRLTDGGSPANGTYDFEFKLYDSASDGNQKGDTVTLGDVTVSDGLFTVELDFGNSYYLFTGDARWLEIGVRAGSSSGAYTTLTPRQALTATPYALSLRPAAQVIGNTGLAPALTAKNTNSAAGVGLYGTTDADTSGAGVRGVATSSSGQVHGVWGESNSISGYGVYGTAPQFGVYGEASRTGNFAYGVYGKSHSAQGAAGYFSNEADGMDIFAAGSGIIRSKADSVLYLSPHDMVVRGSSNVQITALDNGGVDIYYKGTEDKYLSIPVSTFGMLFGSRLYVKAIKVCYRVKEWSPGVADTKITATSVIKNNGSTGSTFYIYDATDRSSIRHSCYTVTSPNPVVIDNSTWVQFNLLRSEAGTHVYIYTVALTLTETP